MFINNSKFNADFLPAFPISRRQSKIFFVLIARIRQRAGNHFPARDICLDQAMLAQRLSRHLLLSRFSHSGATRLRFISFFRYSPCIICMQEIQIQRPVYYTVERIADHDLILHREKEDQIPALGMNGDRICPQPFRITGDKIKLSRAHPLITILSKKKRPVHRLSSR